MKRKNKKELENTPIKTAQAFTNIRDIRNQFLYTLDGYIFMYIRVEPIGIDLLSDTEKRVIADNMTAEMSRETEGYSFYAFDRAVDIKPLIVSYRDLRDRVNKGIRGKILNDDMTFLGTLAQSGGISEKQFVYAIWMPYALGVEQRLSKRAGDFLRHLEVGKLDCRLMDEMEIRQMCMFYFNPELSHLDSGSYNPAIPFIKDQEEGEA